MLTPAEQTDLISSLGFSLDKNNKAHFAPSKIRILYHIYNVGKGCAEVYPGAENIADKLGISDETVSRFVNSREFAQFGVKINRPYTSNLYILHPWVIECFRFLEKKGFMKHFRDDFKKWRKLWQFRMPKYYMNTIMNISTWSEVTYNKRHATKLSTKPLDRCGTAPPHRCGTTRSFGGIYEDVYITNSGSPPILQEYVYVIGELQSGLSIKEGDIHWIISNLSLKEIRGGVRISQSRRGWKPNSPIRGFMSCVDQYKKEKLNERRNSL